MNNNQQNSMTTPTSSSSNSRPTHRRKHSSQSSQSKHNQSPSIKLNSANPPLKRLKLSSPELQPTETSSSSSSFPKKTDEFITNEEKSFNFKETNQDIISLNDDGNDNQTWSTVLHSKASKGKLKKQQKLLKNQQLHPAEFHFDTRGFKNGRIIQLKDVRDLVLSITADERSQDWMLVKNKSNINKTVALMIPGITPITLGVEKPSTNLGMPFSISSESSKLPAFQSLFSHACPTKAGGDRLRMFSCLSVFLTCQMSAWAKAKRDEERKKNQKTISSSDPTLFLLQEDIMTEQGYPKPIYSTPLTASLRQTQREKNPINTNEPTTTTKFEDWIQTDGWIQTPWTNSTNSIENLGKPLRLIGIDCEMCITEQGSELTRCTIVGKDGKPILDELVKPESPIINYLTRFSGITEKRLQGITTTLRDVQEKLSSLIDFDTVLVGHSLECDLRALKLLHPWVIDTSVIYQHPKGLPMKPSLKWLAQKWLNKEIQINQPGSTVLGHDSEEDARTAIELVLKKMEKGAGFGEFINDVESIFERMSRGSEPKRVAVIDHGGGMNCSKATSSMVCKTDAEVVDGLISHLENHEFLFGRLMDLSHGIGWSKAPTPKASYDTPAQEESLSTPLPISKSSIETLHKNLSNQIIKLNESLPKGTALIIFTGHDDPREMVRLNSIKSKFDQACKNGSTPLSDEIKWMGAQERELVDQVEKCKLGMSFFRVK